jgi:CRISPR-associated protein (TIGR03984 family)
MDTFADDPITWLSKKMQDHQLKYLLAHADDGVIWGRLDGQKLSTSNEVASEISPPLRMETLQMVRVFAPAGELLVWRNEDGKWSGRLITEITEPNATNKQASKPNTESAQSAPIDEWAEAFDEQQILLGTKAVSLDKGFYLMSEGAQGLLHAVPLYPVDIGEQHRTLRLVVRHYLKEDEYGFTRVNASRLVNLLLEPKESSA